MPPPKKINRSGFTLLAVLASTTMASFLMIYITGIIRTGLRGQNTVDNQIQFDILQTSLMHLFRNDVLCRASFRKEDGTPYLLPLGPSPSPTPVALEILLGNTKLAYVGKDLGNGAVLTRVNLQVVDGPNLLATGNYRSSLVLFLSMNRNAQSYGSRTLNNDTNPHVLDVELDPTGRVVRCYTEETGTPPNDPPDPNPSPSPSPSPSPGPSPSPSPGFDLVGCTTHTVRNGRYQCAVGQRAAFVSCSFRETLGRDDVYPRVSGRNAYCDGSNDVNSGIALCCADVP